MTWLARYTVFVLIALVAVPVAAQKTAYVQGIVVDTLGAPIAAANVFVSGSKGKDSARVIASGTTDARGRFALRKVPAGRPLVITARKLGYGVASAKVLSFTTDTTEIRFELSAVALNTIYVTAALPREYLIDSTEINKRGVQDALDVVMRYKPRMLGDTYKNCPPDTSTLTVDRRFYPRQPRFMGDIRHSAPFRLFINGVLHMEQGAKDILAKIPAKDILEMRYVSCWDKNTPELNNSLIVILKPGRQY